MLLGLLLFPIIIVMMFLFKGFVGVVVFGLIYYRLKPGLISKKIILVLFVISCVLSFLNLIGNWSPSVRHITLATIPTSFSWGYEIQLDYGDFVDKCLIGKSGVKNDLTGRPFKTCTGIGLDKTCILGYCWAE